MTAVPNKLAWVFHKSGTNLTVALDISKAFNRVWHTVLPHKVESYRILGRVFGNFCLFSVIDAI